MFSSSSITFTPPSDYPDGMSWHCAEPAEPPKPSPIDALRESLEPDVKETPKRARALTDKALLPIVEQLEAEIKGLRTFAHKAHKASIDSNAWHRESDGSMAKNDALYYIGELHKKIHMLETLYDRDIDGLRTKTTITLCLVAFALLLIPAIAFYR